MDRVDRGSGRGRRIATYLGALIGLGSEEPTTGDRRGEMFAAWATFLEALADERPLVLVFEDLHWADDALLDFVDEIVEQVSGVPLLVIATARPELLERRPGWAGGKAGALTISIPPLSGSDTTQLVAALLERTTVTAETHEALLARIGGNPLYAEQLCRILVEHGRLEELPDSLHGIIAARLDALTDVEKRVLQDAAVVGKAFWAGALEAIGGISRRDAEQLLQGLVAASSFGEGALIGRGRHRVRVPPRASPGSRVRGDPARGAGPSDTGARPSGSTRWVDRRITPSCWLTTTSPHSRTNPLRAWTCRCSWSAPSKRSTARACGRSGCRRTSARSSTSPARSP